MKLTDQALRTAEVVRNAVSEGNRAVKYTGVEVIDDAGSFTIPFPEGEILVMFIPLPGEAP